jgi:DNA-binding response OmpR family regulator
VTLKEFHIQPVHNNGNHDSPPAQTSRPTVLIVDDDAGLLRLLKAILRTANYDVATAINGSDALEVAERQHLDLIVLDMRMPVLDGPGFFRELRARGDTTPVLLTSALAVRDAQRELGAEGSIQKPFEPEDLLEAVGSLIH